MAEFTLAGQRFEALMLVKKLDLVAMRAAYEGRMSARGDER